MMPIYLLLTLSISLASAQNSRFSFQNQPSVTLEEDNLDDSITQIFNICKCVIFYRCDEDNFIIPEDQIRYTQVTSNKPLRTISRIRCSNDFYYCCKNRNETRRPVQSSTARPFRSFRSQLTTTALSQYMPPSSFSYSNCGQAGFATSSKIIDEFPWVVAIYQKRKTNKYKFVCGGSLIHPRVVMTEQQCVHSYPSDDFKIVTGKEFLPENVKLLRVEKIIKHEVYRSEGMYDIALIILRTPLTNTRTICLPSFNQNFNGKRCKAVGWSGATQSGSRKLRKVSLPIVDSQTCQNLLRNTSLGSNFQVHPSYICAGGEDGEDTCKNDGGSPLMCEENGRYVQVGIVAWGLRCGEKDVPSLYTNVANLVNWIQQKLEGDF